MKLRAKDIIKMSKEQVLSLPPGTNYRVKLSDVEVKTSSRRIMLTWFYWQLFKEFPGATPDSSCIIPNGPYHAGIHRVIASFVLWTAYQGCKQKDKNTIWDMSKRIYEITNEIFNFTGGYLGEYLNTLSLKDLHTLLNNPTIAGIKERYARGELSIDDTYTEVFTHMEKDDPLLRDNEIRKGVLAGVLDKRSIAQTVGPRGYVKDINGVSFNHPIDVGYAEGLNSAYDSMIESCSAKRALYMQYGPLEKSEYFNRRIQLHLSVISSVKGEDCKSKHYIRWDVRPDDLAKLVGKVMVKDNGGYHVIRESDTQLIGKKINIRSITLCNNADVNTVCETCIGHNALVLPPKENLGLALSVGPCSEISQRILSTKHVEISMEALVLQLDDKARNILRHSKGNKWITDFKKPTAKDGYYVLKFSAMEARFLGQVRVAENVEDLSPARISSLNNIEVLAFDRRDNLVGAVAVNTTVGGAGSSLTTDFLSYLKEYGWTQEEGIISVNLSHWDYRKHFLVSPRRNEDVIQFLKSIELFLFSDDTNSGTDSLSIMGSKTCTNALMQFIDLVSPPDTPEYSRSPRININLSEAEVFIRAAMCRDPKKYNFNMPRAGESFVFERVHYLLSKRSVGGLFAFEGQKKEIFDPLTYVNTNRPPHLLDPLLG